MLTCPYSEKYADTLVEAVVRVQGLAAERLNGPLYTDDAFPVLIEACEVKLEADGTIRSRDALAWFVQATVEHAREATVAETWWNVRYLTLGRPHGARSSLLVNDYTGRHMRKILETLNESGMFGPIKEVSLGMLSQRKRDSIGQTLLQAALDAAAPLDSVTDEARELAFELRGETCKARIRDTWGDGMEYSVRVRIGENDLSVSVFYYPEGDKLEHTDPTGKRKLAENSSSIIGGLTASSQHDLSQRPIREGLVWARFGSLRRAARMSLPGQSLPCTGKGNSSACPLKPSSSPRRTKAILTRWPLRIVTAKLDMFQALDIAFEGNRAQPACPQNGGATHSDQNVRRTKIVKRAEIPVKRPLSTCRNSA